MRNKNNQSSPTPQQAFKAKQVARHLWACVRVQGNRVEAKEAPYLPEIAINHVKHALLIPISHNRLINNATHDFRVSNNHPPVIGAHGSGSGRVFHKHSRFCLQINHNRRFFIRTHQQREKLFPLKSLILSSKIPSE